VLEERGYQATSDVTKFINGGRKYRSAMIPKPRWVV